MRESEREERMLRWKDQGFQEGESSDGKEEAWREDTRGRVNIALSGPFWDIERVPRKSVPVRKQRELATLRTLRSS